MSSKPSWARDDASRQLVDAASAQEKLRAEGAADRLHLRGGVGDLPLDRGAAGQELGDERRARSASRPRTRRWKALDKHDQTIDELQGKQAGALARVQQAEEALREAPDHDAKTLAAWLAGGEKGERPTASLYERERDRDAAALLLAAVGVELDKALERRVEHVESHRQTMLNDARKDVDDGRERLLAHARKLPALRQELLDSRENLLWAAAYPDMAESFGFPTATALGLREPVKRALGTDARIEHRALMEALEEDANALAEAFGAETKRQLGIVEPRTPLTQAMWDNDEDNIRWKKSELERARKLAAWSANPHQLGAEARDFRP